VVGGQRVSDNGERLTDLVFQNPAQRRYADASETFPANQDLDPAALRRAFGVFPTGVVSVAARVEGRLLGLAASSFTSVSLDPPLVSISVSNSSRTWLGLRRAARLGITVLADHHGSLARQLSGPAQHRFDDVDVALSAYDAAIIAGGLAHFETSLYREVEAGDHTLALLRIHAIAQEQSASPLVFHRSVFHSLAGERPAPYRAAPRSGS
jgi:flavin reductase (DIM6/NTAB) family NADH-FMN oxidoreductase RutF